MQLTPLPCTVLEEWGQERIWGLQAAIRGSELTTDLSFYAGWSHHQGENENAASGGALADPGLHLWPPKNGTAFSRVGLQQEFLIFHQLGSLFSTTGG